MSPSTRVLLDIVLQTALISLFIASVLSLAFGIAMVLGSTWSMRLSANMNRWVSTRKMLRPLEVRRDIQRQVYQRHPLIGAILLIGAAFVLYFLFLRYDPVAFQRVFKGSLPAQTLDWLLQSLWWIVLVTNIFGMAVGAVMVTRPSLLKGIESWADRVYSTREVGKFWETMNHQPDRFVQNYPRLFGWLVVAGSLYASLTLGLILAGRLVR
jgi:hypothetical protein